MKKIFNYALLAAALLVGVNVNAENVAKIGMTEYATLQEAINAATNGQTITLIGDKENIESENVNFFKPADAMVSLDLAEHNLKFGTSAKGGYNFRVVRGTLNVTGKGTITNQREVTDPLKPLDNQCESVFGVFGYWGKVDSAAVYSKLIIGEQVKVIGGKNGICVMEMTASNVNVDAATNLAQFGYRYTNHVFADGSGVASGAHVEVNGTVDAQKYGIKVNGSITRPDAKEAFATYVPSKDKQGNPTGPTDNYTKWQDYGNVKEYIDCAPYVTVGSVGHIIASATAAEATAIYSSGYGHWVIKGTCEGSTGVYIKSGTVRIEDATITSTSTNPWEEPGKEKGSGIDAGGSAIVIESQDGYAGATDVVITGDSKITAATGYAIESATNSTDSKVNSITIEGGTFTGGTEGGVTFDGKTNDKGVVDVEGGNYDKNDVNSYIDATKGGNVTVIENEDGTTTYVIGKDETRPVETDETAWHKNADLSNLDYLMWDGKGAGVAEVNSDITISKEFKMNDGEIKIMAGKTFTVEKLVMGANAKITVSTDATLIINGTTGVVAPAKNNIIVEAEEDDNGQLHVGQLLFNPQVASNRRPMATVRLISHSWGVDAEHYMNQFFGMPMASVQEITMDKGNDIWAKFSIWRYTAWDRVGYLHKTPAMDYSKFNIPFGICDISTNNLENEWTTFDITGNLLGNTNPDNFRILKGWTSAANAWTGDCDVAAFEERLEALADQGVTQYIYTYKYIDHVVTWDAVDETLNPLTKIAPMQPVMFENSHGNAFTSDIMSYKELVWDKRNSNKAPRVAMDMNAVAIRIAAENGASDAMAIKEAPEFEGGKNAPKYMNEAICVYATTDENLAILASDNVENTFIGFNCAKAGKYTVSFENVRGENFVLVDLNNNARINMVEGATYEFYAGANEANDHRFLVVRGAKAPTKMDKVDAKANAAKVISGGEFRIVKDGRAYNAMGAEL